MLAFPFGVSQNKTKPDAKYDLKRCIPNFIRNTAHGKTPEFHFRQGETNKNPPIIAYEILESGGIAHSFVTHSSGVADLDRYALNWVQGFKFNKRPGCGVVEFRGTVIIDFAGAMSDSSRSRVQVFYRVSMPQG